MTDPAGLLQALRRATQPLHDQLEVQPSLCALTAADLTPQSYLQALKALYFPHYCLEEAVNRYSGIHQPDLMVERRHRYLAMDIQALNAEVPSAEAIAVPEIRHQAELAGILYVLEGSRLGGQVICQHLEHRFPDVEHHFFRSSDLSMSQFAAFINALAEDMSPALWPDAQRGAQRAFHCFLHYAGN